MLAKGEYILNFNHLWKNALNELNKFHIVEEQYICHFFFKICSCSRNVIFVKTLGWARKPG